MMERERAEIAAKAWLGSMRKAWLAKYGLERGECPVPAWEALPVTDRAILIHAMNAALGSVTPDALKRLAERTG